MQSACAIVNELHESYNARTGAEIELNMVRERLWGEWLAWRTNKFTPEDLARVIGWLKGKIRDGWDSRCLSFSKLIGEPDKFEEYLSEAKGAIKQAEPAGPPKTYRPIVPLPPEQRADVNEFAAFAKQHGRRAKTSSTKLTE